MCSTRSQEERVRHGGASVSPGLMSVCLVLGTCTQYCYCDLEYRIQHIYVCSTHTSTHQHIAGVAGLLFIRASGDARTCVSMDRSGHKYDRWVAAALVDQAAAAQSSKASFEEPRLPSRRRGVLRRRHHRRSVVVPIPLVLWVRVPVPAVTHVDHWPAASVLLVRMNLLCTVEEIKDIYVAGLANK